jgi:8-oxo-dGTP pyrophosphatase MutT (NUDIX family)
VIGAERELLEETGYKPSHMIHWKTSDFGMSVLSFCDYYIARDCEWIQDILPDSGEKIELAFLDFEEFLMLSENPLFQHKDIVADLFLARIYPEKRTELFNLLFGVE